mgnify:CR=1 FL=1
MAKRVLVGAHLSIAGGIEKSFAHAQAVDASCFQIFTRSSRSWNAKLYSAAEITAFKQAQKETGIDVVVAHAPYLINLASVTPATRDGSVTLLTSELQRAQSLGLQAVVLHPGAHGGDGEDVGVERVARGLEQAFTHASGDTVVALETMAGQGTSLGSRLESLKKIYDECSYRSRIQFCIDTCHIYSAGYDISSGLKFAAFLDEFDRVLGLGNLAVIHCNDSQVPFDARVDRHAMLGKGSIPTEIFEVIMNDERLVHVPKILETPAEKEGTTYGPEIALLRSLVRK